MAAQIIALQDADLSSRLEAWRQSRTDEVLANPTPGL